MGNRQVIAFFDLDRTLLDGASGNIFAKRLVLERYMKPSALVEVIRITLLYELNRLPVERVYAKAIEMMYSVPLDEMLGFLDRSFEFHMMPRLFQGGVDIVKTHREKGHLTVIATATGDYVAERVRVQLGAYDAIASHLPLGQDTLDPEQISNMAYGDGKRRLAEAYCEERGALMEDAWFYSDSASDLPLLEAVGHPVLVNPSRGFLRQVRDRNWPVLRFRKYAKFDSVVRPERLNDPVGNEYLLAYEKTLADGSPGEQ